MFSIFPSVFITLYLASFVIGNLEEREGVKYADKCEVCKVVATELEARLEETGRTHDVLEFGYSIENASHRKKKYEKSELRLVESMENVCERILEYNIHKEKTDSTRFAKGMSQTFKTLHGLVKKGVKVELGIPYELWDNPSVEITTLKTQCENLLENYESDIEDWYHNYQERVPLTQYLCLERALKGQDNSCLKENNAKKNTKVIKAKKVTESKNKTKESSNEKDEL